MANQITDNRTLIDSAESATPYDDLAGAANGTLDGEIFYQGSNSIGGYATTTRDGLLYDAGSVQTAWANSHFYLLVNCGIVGLLDTKANGGLTIRFAGNTVGDFFEFYVGGSDDWPTAFNGGWVQFVVDIEATPSNTGGTTPNTNAIRYVGISFVTASTMPRMADNTWLDEIRRLGDGNPGIIIEGRNGGSTDWAWDDVIGTTAIVDAATCRRGPGGSVVLNTPVQFFIDDASTHAFTDTNQTLLWDDQEFAATDLYGLTQLGAVSGTSNLTAGVKSGSGDDASGSQGWTIQAAGAGVRWFLDVDDADIDSSNWYGCNFNHGDDFQLDGPNVSTISCVFNDCTSCRADNSADFLRNVIVSANTADGVAFLTIDDIGDAVFCSFFFSDGHAIQLTTPRVATQGSKGNLFSGYAGTPGSNLVSSSGSNDAAVYNLTAGAVTINITEGGDTPAIRNGASATTTVVSAVDLIATITNQEGGTLSGINVRFQESDGTLIAQGQTNGSGVFSFAIDAASLPLSNASVRVRNKRFEDSDTILNIPTNGFNIPIKLEPDTDVNLP